MHHTDSPFKMDCVTNNHNEGTNGSNSTPTNAPNATVPGIVAAEEESTSIVSTLQSLLSVAEDGTEERPSKRKRIAMLLWQILLLSVDPSKVGAHLHARTAVTTDAGCGKQDLTSVWLVNTYWNAQVFHLQYRNSCKATRRKADVVH